MNGAIGNVVVGAVGAVANEGAMGWIGKAGAVGAAVNGSTVSWVGKVGVVVGEMYGLVNKMGYTRHQTDMS